MENEFLEYMPDTVIIRPFAGRDSRNRPSYGDPQRYRCRIAGQEVALRRSAAEDSTVIYNVWTDGIPVDVDRHPIEGAVVGVFSVDDDLTLPADIRLGDQTPEIFSVGRYPDPEGIHHYRIQCGFMYHRQTA
jgi:hypothetical protein